MKKLLIFIVILLLITIGGLLVFAPGSTMYDKAKTIYHFFRPTNQAAYHVVIVPGYGVPVQGNSVYEGYIKKVAAYVDNPNNHVNGMIFSGGYTSSQTVSEAQAMNSYFNSVADLTSLKKRGVQVYQETCSIVTFQNIGYSRDILTAHSIVPAAVTVFGDSSKQNELLAYANAEFRKTGDVNVQGYDFGSAVLNSTKQDLKDLTTLVGVTSTKISNTVLQQRITQLGTQFHYDVAKNLVAHGCSQFKGFN